MTLQPILDCAEDFFSNYDANRDEWMNVRGHCEGLLGAEDFWRYQELCDKDAFDYDCERNRLTDWKDLLDKFDPDEEDVGSSDYVENNSKVMHERVIAYDQLKAFSLYLKDKPAELAAYCEFLVSVFSMVLACIIIAMIIISHHHSAGALQSRGYCQQGAWAAIDFHGTGEIRVGSGGRKYGSCRGRRRREGA